MRGVTGVILAGGKSKRMGRDKLFLDIGGVPLFQHIYKVLRQVFNDLIVVTNNPEPFDPYNIRVVTDLIPGKGALGGLYTGLKSTFSEGVFCFAADMPFLNSQLIRYMIERGSEGDVIIPKTSDGLEPLHAIYSKNCLKPIETLISRGELKIIDFLQEVTVIYVSEEEILKYDPMLTCFLNVNTEEDFRHVQNIFSQGSWGHSR